jgi:SagB-type dehydrogenase family enzyme
MSAEEHAMEAWRPWNPAAGFFHLATKDVPFVDMPRQVRTLRTKAKASPMPPAVKRYRGARRIPLPSNRAIGEFADTLLARRTWRRFAADPVDLASFGTLLGLTAGIQHWAHAAGEGKVALKTSPSGGARHSIEVYVLARRVEGLAVGIYHYAADGHALELVHVGARRHQIERYLPHQPWYTTAAAVVFFTSVFQRALWRYEYARAYRAILIEAGHLCQTFCLTATWLGLAPFCTMALADSRIEKDLGLDGISESVLYAAGVGTRPANTEAPKSRAGAPSMLKRAEVQKFPGKIIGSSR